MSVRKKRRAAPTPKQALIGLVCAAAAFLVLVILNEGMGGQLPLPTVAQLHSVLDNAYRTTGLSPSRAPVEGELLVHFVDVGQADCELIQTPEQNILIDAGDIGGGGEVAAYLRGQGVERLDLVIATHPHADHIGGMAEVVEQFEIGRVLFSEIPDSILPTSKTYLSLLDAIEQKGLKLTKAKPGAQYDLGGGAALTILGPLTLYDDLNDASVVCRLDYGDTSFLFTGDAETPSEEDLLRAYSARELRADLLKLGHHGSSTSTSDAWLDAVSPTYAVAQVGYDNSYGHPHAETLKKLKERKTILFRTDLDGTIVAASDGQELTFAVENAA